jgi:hypothetical protein
LQEPKDASAVLSDAPSLVPSDQPSQPPSVKPSAAPGEELLTEKSIGSATFQILPFSDYPSTFPSDVPSSFPSTVPVAAQASIATGAILGFTLVNADTKEVISSLLDGDAIYLSLIGATSLSIRADVVETVVEKVRFTFEGIENTEGQAPFILYGKRGSSSFVPVASLSRPGIKTMTVEAIDFHDDVIDDRWLSFTVEE